MHLSRRTALVHTFKSIKLTYSSKLLTKTNTKWSCGEGFILLLPYEARSCLSYRQTTDQDKTKACTILPHSPHSAMFGRKLMLQANQTSTERLSTNYSCKRTTINISICCHINKSRCHLFCLIQLGENWLKRHKIY